MALKQVNCPITINPHQIQGLDYPLIYQILQWLVKKLLETRDERNFQNKLLTNKYFTTNISSVYSKSNTAKNHQDAHNKKYSYYKIVSKKKSFQKQRLTLSIQVVNFDLQPNQR